MENKMNYSCECRPREADQEATKVVITKRRRKKQMKKLLSVFGKYAKAMSYIK